MGLGLPEIQDNTGLFEKKYDFGNKTRFCFVLRIRMLCINSTIKH